MANPLLRKKLEAGDFIFAPGAQDMIAAVIAKKIGIQIIYGSGYWTVASAYGLPDAGIATFGQMLERMATLVRTTDAAVIADADTGFGGLINVHHTVKGYESAGISAIQLEDQQFPKKCGHFAGRKVVESGEMQDKVKVAVDARCDDNMLVIARTDSRDSLGLEAAIDRVNAYGEAGADVLFIEGLRDEEEMRLACSQTSLPMMVNMASGGNTPMKTVDQMKDYGLAIAIVPGLCSLVAAKATENALRAMMSEGNPEPDTADLFCFQEFSNLIGFDEIRAFESKWSASDRCAD